MARRPGGPELVAKLDGDDTAKTRLRVVLETMSGARSVEEACALLAVGPTRFEELRRIALEGALAALEPKPMGRPAARPIVESGEIVRLREENERLKNEIVIAHVREELAIGFPRRALEKKR